MEYIQIGAQSAAPQPTQQVTAVASSTAARAGGRSVGGAAVVLCCCVEYQIPLTFLFQEKVGKIARFHILCVVVQHPPLDIYLRLLQCASTIQTQQHRENYTNSTSILIPRASFNHCLPLRIPLDS